MAVQNSLTRSKSNQRFGITAYLTQDAVKQQINNVIGGKDGQRFISAIVSAVNTNPALQVEYVRTIAGRLFLLAHFHKLIKYVKMQLVINDIPVCKSIYRLLIKAKR